MEYINLQMQEWEVVQKLQVVMGHLYKLTRMNRNTSLALMFIIRITEVRMAELHGVQLLIRLQ